MFPRWLWFNHVPAGIDLSPQQYAEVKRLVRELGPGQRRFSPMSRRMLKLLIPGLILLLAVFGAWLIFLIRSRPPAGVAAPLHVAGVLLFQAALWVLIGWSINRAVAPLVWRALNMIGVRICESCGYILENLPAGTDRCPECGSPSPSVAGTERPQPPTA